MERVCEKEGGKDREKERYRKKKEKQKSGQLKSNSRLENF